MKAYARDEPVPGQGGGGSGGVVSALINAGSTYYAGQTAKRNTDKTISANKNLAEYAYAQDLEMWNRMNEYNNPRAQMQRLSEAGLNPHLVYGTGTVGNTSGQMPQYNAPNVEYKYQPYVDGPAIQQGILAYQDMRLRDAQVDNVKANTVNTEQSTALKVIDELKHVSDAKKAELESAILENTKSEIVAQQQYKTDQAAQDLDIGREKYIQSQLQSAIKAQEKRWMESGITPRDKAYMRIIMTFMNQFGMDTKWLTDIIKKVGG